MRTLVLTPRSGSCPRILMSPNLSLYPINKLSGFPDFQLLYLFILVEEREKKTIAYHPAYLLSGACPPKDCAQMICCDACCAALSMPASGLLHTFRLQHLLLLYA